MGLKMDTENRWQLISVSICFFTLMALSSCSNAPTVTTPAPLPSATISPPTAVSTNLPVPILPTSTPNCIDDLSFVEDATIPDDSIVSPGSVLDKQWLVQNSGSCNWDDRYRMRLISGELMGTTSEQALYPARAGSQAILRIIFTAPAEPGEYVSEWQAFDYGGIPFGDTFFIKSIVQG
jgi:hypothetical protein